MVCKLNNKRVIVVGGGISGLSVAFWLKQKGIEVLLLERESRAGGLIRTEKRNGFLLDHAANCIFNYLPEVNFVCNTSGLGSSKVFRREEAKRRYLLKEGHPTAAPMNVRDFISTDLWSARGKLRFLMEPLVPKGAAGSAETVEQFITRRFGREVFERSIEPYVAGTLAGDAGRSCIKSTFRQFSAIEEEHGSILRGALKRKFRGVRTSCSAEVFSFREGMESLAGALRDFLGDSFLGNSSAGRVERAGRKWEVEVSTAGRREVFSADAVVMATPAFDTAEVLEPLSKNIAMLLKGIEYSPMAVACLGFEKRSVAHPLDGIGCLVPRRERSFSILGSLWSSTLFEGRSPEGMVLMTNYLGGARDRGAMDRSDDEIISLCMKDLERMAGVRGEPVMTRVVRHERALPQYAIGHQILLRKLEENLSLLPGIFITGNYLDGVSIRACISRGMALAEKVDSCLRVGSGRFEDGNIPASVAEKKGRF